MNEQSAKSVEGAGTAAEVRARVGSGAAALGRESVAVGERGVNVAGDVAGPIFTGDIDINVGDLAGGIQNQALQQSLQALLAQAFNQAERPQIEEIFRVVREPEAVQAVLFEAERQLPVRPYEVPYQAVDEDETTPGTGRVWLLRGRSGLGRTRRAAEWARRLCAEGWTVCVARLDNCRKMAAPAGVLPDRKLLCVVDDVQRHARAGAGEKSYMERLKACLRFFEQDPEVDVLLLATAPEGAATLARTWPTVSVLELAELPRETLETILRDAAEVAGIALAQDEAAALAADSDGTPKTMVANVNQAALAGEALTAARWHNTWRGTWQESFDDTRQRYAGVDAVYEAVHLLRAAGLPARSAYVSAVSRARGGQAVAETVQALVARGLLRAEGDRLAPFVEEQIEVSLESVGKALPQLMQDWQALTQTLVNLDEAAADDLATLADTLNVMGEHADAELAASAALARAPGHGPAAYERGLARARQDRYEGADEDFTTALEAEYRPASAALMRGLTRFMLGQYEAATGDFDVAISGGEALAYKGRGLARLFRQSFGDAVEDLSEALARLGEDGELYYLRGLAQYAKEDAAAALADYDRAIAAGFEQPGAYFARGWLHWRTGDLEEAEADFTQVLREVGNAFIYYLRGIARYQQGNLAGAEEDLSKCIARWQEDDYIDVLQRLARALAEADEETTLEALLMAHPEWMHRLTAALPGGELPPDTPAETLAGVARFWARLVEEQLAQQTLPFTALAQLAGQPYLARGAVRFDAEQFEAAADDFREAAKLGADPTVVQYNLGRAYVALDRLEAAEAAFTEAMAHAESKAVFYFMRGTVRHDRGLFMEAEADLTRAVEGGYEPAPLYALRGWSRFQLGRYKAAEADFTAAVTRGIDDARTYYGRAAARFNLEQYAQAAADYTEALARGLDDALVFLERSAARLEIGQYAGAERDASRALARGLSQEEDRLYHLRGWARLRQGEAKGASEDLAAALERGFDAPLTYYGRALATNALKEYEEAERAFSQAIEHGLDIPVAYSGRGSARLHLGDFTGAEADLTQAIESGDDEADVFINRAQARVNLDDRAGAVADCTEALARGYGIFATWLRGICYFELGRHEEALPDLSARNEEGSAPLDVYLCRAQAHYFLGQYEAAAADATKVIALDNEQVFARQLRASARAHAGDVDGARADCERAEALAPDDVVNEDCWAEVSMAEGAYEEAIVRYEAALEREDDNLRLFNVGLAYVLAGQVAEGLRRYEAGLDGANAADIKLARRDAEHWPQRAESPTAAQEEALAQVRMWLESAATFYS